MHPCSLSKIRQPASQGHSPPGRQLSLQARASVSRPAKPADPNIASQACEAENDPFAGDDWLWLADPHRQSGCLIQSWGQIDPVRFNGLDRRSDWSFLTVGSTKNNEVVGVQIILSQEMRAYSCEGDT